jgi:hypothetical protein
MIPIPCVPEVAGGRAVTGRRRWRAWRRRPPGGVNSSSSEEMAVPSSVSVRSGEVLCGASSRSARDCVRPCARARHGQWRGPGIHSIRTRQRLHGAQVWAGQGGAQLIRRPSGTESSWSAGAARRGRSGCCRAFVLLVVLVVALCGCGLALSQPQSVSRIAIITGADSQNLVARVCLALPLASRLARRPSRRPGRASFRWAPGLTATPPRPALGMSPCGTISRGTTAGAAPRYHRGRASRPGRDSHRASEPERRRGARCPHRTRCSYRMRSRASSLPSVQCASGEIDH